MLHSTHLEHRPIEARRAADLPVQVIELHIHDEDVCANCSYPAVLDGRCVCGDWRPTPSLFVLAYRDVRATIAANRLAGRCPPSPIGT